MDLSDDAAAHAPPQGEGEIARLVRDLENSIAHLVRSNRELEEFLQENGEDKELRVAIGENIVTIARRRAQLEDLIKQAGLEPSAMLDGTVLAAADTKQPAAPVVPESGVYL